MKVWYFITSSKKSMEIAQSLFYDSGASYEDDF
jgi:hypothetical protein